MAANKNNRDSDRESQKPYTPPPPQHMDPSKPPKNHTDRKQQRKTEPRKYSAAQVEKKSKPKELGESETEIDDETTI
jgi:hypothetical protein